MTRSSSRIARHSYFSDDFPLRIMEVTRQAAISEHTHEFYEMVYVRRGRGRHWHNGAAHLIQPGDLYVIAPGERHAYEPLRDETLGIVNILWMPALIEKSLRATLYSKTTVNAGASPNAEVSLNAGGTLSTQEDTLAYIAPVLQRQKRSKKRFAPRLQLTGTNALRVERFIEELRRELESEAPGREMMVRHYFCALLIFLSRAHLEQQKRREATPSVLLSTRSARAAAGPGAVERAIAYIENHYTQSLRVAEIARAAALSPSRLAHVFKSGTGRSINAYVHELRIARACRELADSDATVADIAVLAGYGDTRFFHRMFLRHTGCTPMAYRTASRQAERGT